MQPAFQSELLKNLDAFKTDKIEYVHEYRTAGPMQTNLTPRQGLLFIEIEILEHSSSKFILTL